MCLKAKSIVDLLFFMLKDNEIISVLEYLKNKNVHNDYKDTMNNLVSKDGVVICSLVIDNVLIDELLFIPKFPKKGKKYLLKIRYFRRF